MYDFLVCDSNYMLVPLEFARIDFIQMGKASSSSIWYELSYIEANGYTNTYAYVKSHVLEIVFKD